MHAFYKGHSGAYSTVKIGGAGQSRNIKNPDFFADVGNDFFLLELGDEADNGFGGGTDDIGQVFTTEGQVDQVVPCRRFLSASAGWRPSVREPTFGPNWLRALP